MNRISDVAIDIIVGIADIAFAYLVVWLVDACAERAGYFISILIVASLISLIFSKRKVANE